MKTCTILLLVTCLGGLPSGNGLPYRLDHPDRKYKLPEKLVEISGMSYLGKKRIACIQDENGNLYRFHLAREEADKIVDFGGKGDYEGVEIIGQTAYVLESDGSLISIHGYTDEDPQIRKYSAPFPDGYNAEGLAYDPDRKELLIAIKEIPKGSKAYSRKRLIFAFLLDESRYYPAPRYTIDMDQVRKKAKKRYGKKTEIEFMPSGVAVHPLSSDIWVISSVGRSLVVIDRKGNILHTERLDSDVFRQPEGICFDNDGDLYISNEGRNKRSNILRFEFQEGREKD